MKIFKICGILFHCLIYGLPLHAQTARTFLPQFADAVLEYDFVVRDTTEILAEGFRRDSLEIIRQEDNKLYFDMDSEPFGAFSYVLNGEILATDLGFGIDFSEFEFPFEIAGLDSFFVEPGLYRFQSQAGDTWKVREIRQEIEISEELREEFSIPEFIQSLDLVIRLDGKRLVGETVEVPFNTLETQVFENRVRMLLETEITIGNQVITFGFDIIEPWLVTTWFAKDIGMVKQHADPYLFFLDGFGFPEFAALIIREDDDDDERPMLLIPGFTFELNGFDPGTPTSINPETDFPVSASLDAIYPNPFNPGTTITYSIQNPGPIRVLVYDILGRHVSTLIDHVHSKGEFQVYFDATGFSGGVYLILLESADFRDVKKVSLVK